MVVDVRKLSIGPVHQHGHFCVRTFHRIISYPGYTLFILFLFYLLTMEFILYSKIRTRNSLDLNSSSIANNPDLMNSIHIFDPLPVKKIMVTPAVNIFD